MEKILRKHILSSYSLTQDFIFHTNHVENSINLLHNGPTVLTEQVETSDADENIMQGVTQETRSIETTDPDSMYAGSTKHTYTIENTDEDEFVSK